MNMDNFSNMKMDSLGQHEDKLIWGLVKVTDSTFSSEYSSKVSSVRGRIQKMARFFGRKVCHRNKARVT